MPNAMVNVMSKNDGVGVRAGVPETQELKGVGERGGQRVGFINNSPKHRA
jgi:hypothetical protein